MYSFLNDYSEGACNEIIEALISSNHEQTVGYGYDAYCTLAKERITKEIGKDVDIHFMCGGTQANLVVIDAMLRSFEAVIACDSGHINVHEAGSIEATGHKIVTVPAIDGKLIPSQVLEVLRNHTDEHKVLIKMVYISNSTETGTIYTKEELEALYTVCKENNLILFVDGARLGNAIMAKDSHLTLKDLANNCDAFYIGGTKNGALFGEAVVFTNNYENNGFRYAMKQHGSILAKGRILGIQFATLFNDGLYYKLAAHANNMAQKLQSAFIECGYELLTNSPTNQIFPIMSEETFNKLSEKYLFSLWEELPNGKKSYRLVTSWDTDETKVDEFIEDLKSLA